MMIDYVIHIKGRCYISGRTERDRLVSFRKKWMSRAYKEFRKCKDAAIHHNVYQVECFDEQWRLKKIFFYGNCLMNEKDFEAVAMMDEHLGFKEFMIGAFHR